MDSKSLMDFNLKKQIVEALIFASDFPIPESRLLALVEDLDQETLKKILAELSEEYLKQHRSFMLSQVAGGYQMVTRPEFASWVKKLFQGKTKTRLSQASLETLAIIAFKQPVSRPQIEAIRGAQCDGVIKTLLERNLITIAGRSEGVGRPLLYKTTEEFLRHFGINAINDLPKPKEITELVDEPENLMDSLQSLSIQMGQRDLFTNWDVDEETLEDGLKPKDDDQTE